MSEFGVTGSGFVPKGFVDILTDAQRRLREMFGADVDLSPTSALAKIVQVAADEDALLWQRMEDVYYSQFASTASGPDLDLLGDDTGIRRRELAAEGQVRLTIQNVHPGRVHVLPAGTIVVTEPRPSPIAFRTLEPVALSEAAPSAMVLARAFDGGRAGNVPAGAIVGVDPDYLRDDLDIPSPTTVTATNPAPFDGGQRQESDTDFRTRLLGFPREMWTVQSVRAAVLDVPGVFDVLLTGPLGGVDVSQSYFNLFLFGQRAFGAARPIGEPYFFGVVVAHDPTRPWRTTGPVTGVYERVRAVVDLQRPVGIHPAIVPAEHVDVGVRAKVVVDPGMDAPALRAALVQALAAGAGALRLGGDVLFSQVTRVLVDQPGVLDVQDLRLRRSPARPRQLTPGGIAPATDVIELAAGENLELAPTEVATFRVGSELSDIQVVAR